MQVRGTSYLETDACDRVPAHNQKLTSSRIVYYTHAKSSRIPYYSSQRTLSLSQYGDLHFWFLHSLGHTRHIVSASKRGHCTVSQFLQLLISTVMRFTVLSFTVTLHAHSGYMLYHIYGIKYIWVIVYDKGIKNESR